MEVYVRKFTTELFDKKDAFYFYINGMPYVDSNINSVLPGQQPHMAKLVNLWWIRMKR